MQITEYERRIAKDRKTITRSMDLIEKLRQQKITWIQKVDELMKVADDLQKALEQVTAEKEVLFHSSQALAAHSEFVAAQLDEAMGKLHVYEQAETVKGSEKEASPDWDALLASQEAHDAAALAAASSPPRAPAATQPPSTKQERKAARSVQISARNTGEEQPATAKRMREEGAASGGAGAHPQKKGAARRLKME